MWSNIKVLVQDGSISIADALEIPQSSTKPSIYMYMYSTTVAAAEHIIRVYT